MLATISNPLNQPLSTELLHPSHYMTEVKRPYTLPPGQRGPMRREMAPMPAIPRQSDFGIHEVSEGS